jgi:hypothetical protein
MQYPLPETIGNPELFVGREEEFESLNEWLGNIPKLLSISTVILARRKSGKTAIIERVFNQCWSDTSLGIIPFFISLGDKDIWLHEFAVKYYQTFASHYISFFERNEEMVKELLSLDQIRQYGVDHSIQKLVDDIDMLQEYKANNRIDPLWELASSAPHRFGSFYNQRILVIIDEFQYFSNHFFLDFERTNHYHTMPGSYHQYVESKYAPMLVSGSYVSWMLNLMEEYLEAGRLDQFYISPYLKKDEGLQAVYKYAEHIGKPITNKTASQINTLCCSDPFFIYCVIKNSKKNMLLTEKGVIETVNHELTHRHSRMVKTWAEYINKTIKKINDKYAKDILLYLCKHNDRTWTPEELKDKLKIDLPVKKIHERLELILEADLIEDGGSDISYKGLTDGTLYLVLRHRFEEEIKNHKPDFKSDFQEKIQQLEQDKKSLRGKLSNLIGKFAEYQLATDMRTRKKFSLTVYFENIKDVKKLNIIDVSLNVKFQRPDGKELEIDVRAESDCKRVVLIEVKKWNQKIGVQVVRDFWEKVEFYSKHHKKNKIIPAILSVGGFSVQAKKLCLEKQIGLAETIDYIW